MSSLVVSEITDVESAGIKRLIRVGRVFQPIDHREEIPAQPEYLGDDPSIGEWIGALDPIRPQELPADIHSASDCDLLRLDAVHDLFELP